MTSPLRRIGYWRNDRHPELPDPDDLVDPDWSADERFTVGTYLCGGLVPWVQMGYSTCRICGERNGSAEYSDGHYVWPEGLAHYVLDHSVRLPSEIVEYIEDRLAPMFAGGVPEIDDDWWILHTRAR